MNAQLFQGDCLEVLSHWRSEMVDLVYLDPPFFTQKEQSLAPRDRSRNFSFDDRWRSISHYAAFLYQRLSELHRVLKPTGVLFFHCDKTASHVARLLLDELFGEEQFQAEIIWSYRRWSNSARKLLPAHQTIFFYAKSPQFTFNTLFTDYSPTTNVDQIMQRRGRDHANKSVYARDERGEVIFGGAKKGVPLSDVWEIPFLNPKAKERTGYPTQKPILLLERIIQLASNECDLILDPFCGSGTALVAAHLLGRQAIGIDVSADALELTRSRLADPVKSDSNLLRKGTDAYQNADAEVLALLKGIPHTPVQRNHGIDALLERTWRGVPIPVRVQRQEETLEAAALALHKAASSKNAGRMLLIATVAHRALFQQPVPAEMIVVDATALSITKALDAALHGPQNLSFAN